MSQQLAHDDRHGASAYGLTEQQRNFYDTFGALRLPGLMAHEFNAISDAFDEVFSSDPEGLVESHERVHFGERRLILMHMIERHPTLLALRHDPRITSVVHDVMGPDAAYLGSDGNIMWCETDWHCDIFKAPIEKRHLKVFLYLEALDASSGALRIIPGTSHYQSEFATGLRAMASRPGGAQERFGVDPRDLPYWAIENQPGDVLLGNYRNLHATFGAVGRARRVITLNYGEEPLADSDFTADMIAFAERSRLTG
jgi:hypothetical protein